MTYFVKRRALSTVVTTALMLTAVAVIGTGVVAWSNSNLRTFENNLVTSASNNTNKINEMPIIENVVLVPYIIIGPTEYVNTTVNNVGTVGINVITITISDYHQTISYPIASGKINPHSSSLFSEPFQYVSGKTVTIQVITGRGTTISTQVLPP